MSVSTPMLAPEVRMGDDDPVFVLTEENLQKKEKVADRLDQMGWRCYQKGQKGQAQMFWQRAQVLRDECVVSRQRKAEGRAF